jgi:hypothetical protein
MKKFLLVILTMVSITSYSQDSDSFFAIVYDLKPNTIKIEHDDPYINMVTNIFDCNVIAIYLIYNNDINISADSVVFLKRNGVTHTFPINGGTYHNIEENISNINFAGTIDKNINIYGYLIINEKTIDIVINNNNNILTWSSEIDY